MGVISKLTTCIHATEWYATVIYTHTEEKYAKEQNGDF